MPELSLVKIGDNLLPAGSHARRTIERMRHGQPIRVEWSCTTPDEGLRRKLFSLFHFAHEQLSLEPVRLGGDAISLPFDTLRKDLLIRAGYFDYVQQSDGRMRLQAISLSPASLAENEIDLAALYSDVLDAVIRKSSTTLTRRQLNALVEQYDITH